MDLNYQDFKDSKNKDNQNALEFCTFNNSLSGCKLLCENNFVYEIQSAIKISKEKDFNEIFDYLQNITNIDQDSINKSDLDLENTNTQNQITDQEEVMEEIKDTEITHIGDVNLPEIDQNNELNPIEIATQQNDINIKHDNQENTSGNQAAQNNDQIQEIEKIDIKLTENNQKEPVYTELSLHENDSTDHNEAVESKENFDVDNLNKKAEEKPKDDISTQKTQQLDINNDTQQQNPNSENISKETTSEHQILDKPGSNTNLPTADAPSEEIMKSDFAWNSSSVEPVEVLPQKTDEEIFQEAILHFRGNEPLNSLLIKHPDFASKPLLNGDLPLVSAVTSRNMKALEILIENKSDVFSVFDSLQNDEDSLKWFKDRMIVKKYMNERMEESIVKNDRDLFDKIVKINPQIICEGRGGYDTFYHFICSRNNVDLLKSVEEYAIKNRSKILEDIQNPVMIALQNGYWQESIYLYSIGFPLFSAEEEKYKPLEDAFVAKDEAKIEKEFDNYNKFLNGQLTNDGLPKNKTEIISEVKDVIKDVLDTQNDMELDSNKIVLISDEFKNEESEVKTNSEIKEEEPKKEEIVDLEEKTTEQVVENDNESVKSVVEDKIEEIKEGIFGKEDENDSKIDEEIEREKKQKAEEEEKRKREKEIKERKALIADLTKIVDNDDPSLLKDKTDNQILTVYEFGTLFEYSQSKESKKVSQFLLENYSLQILKQTVLRNKTDIIKSVRTYVFNQIKKDWNYDYAEKAFKNDEVLPLFQDNYGRTLLTVSLTDLDKSANVLKLLLKQKNINVKSALKKIQNNQIRQKSISTIILLSIEEDNTSILSELNINSNYLVNGVKILEICVEKKATNFVKYFNEDPDIFKYFVKSCQTDDVEFISNAFQKQMNEMKTSEPFLEALKYKAFKTALLLLPLTPNIFDYEGDIKSSQNEELICAFKTYKPSIERIIRSDRIDYAEHLTLDEIIKEDVVKRCLELNSHTVLEFIIMKYTKEIIKCDNLARKYSAIMIARDFDPSFIEKVTDAYPAIKRFKVDGKSLLYHAARKQKYKACKLLFPPSDENDIVLLSKEQCSKMHPYFVRWLILYGNNDQILKASQVNPSLFISTRVTDKNVTYFPLQFAEKNSVKASELIKEICSSYVQQKKSSDEMSNSKSSASISTRRSISKVNSPQKSKYSPKHV
ncbi:hypothetical protein TVAG_072710 [Trichomonas vaginalis G3]|uniref:Uncharacterized protein n=1 Tax=Trichomonas vaginalis (strain ATCC PRA-98 / G3) TaxID=412133 RepID=A2FYU2_TRIV3|nr:Ankyrin repeat family [Trichomonas vaginalis G3]EAX89925.1 hypothetical protein TVAG_072710 [Trichomonas vaginalis G3]KAI5505393.1 Ankyrin repeat family [Trichomonas vaginalis G3]|eukprot:XP_001302855.1 hypothetical protein [Trichomonas vaginalis G3]